MSENQLKVVSPEVAGRLEFRPAEVGDLGGIASLAFALQREIDGDGAVTNVDSEMDELHRIYRFRLSEGVSGGLKHIIFVAEDPLVAGPIAFIVGHVPSPKPEGDFYALRRGRYVMPGYRGKGVSTHLAECFSKAAKEFGASHIEFEVCEAGDGREFLTKHATPLKEVVDVNGSKRIRFREEI